MYKKYLYFTALVLFISINPVRSSRDLKLDERSFQSSIRSSHLLMDDVVVTFNRNCELGKTFLTKNLKVEIKDDRYSPEESVTVRLTAPLTALELEALAQEDPCVVEVSKHMNVELFGINDPLYKDQTHLPFIKYEKTFDFFYSGKIKKNSIIAIIDNGVDIDHEDIKKNLWVNSQEKNGFPGIDDDRNGYIDDVYGYDFSEKVGDPNHKSEDFSPLNSHGTHVASLAAAVTENSVGVSGTMAQNVKIMALNVFGKSSYAKITDLDAAIRYAADMGANVINMSLGGKGISASTERAIKYAISKGVFIVAAAGNNGQELSDTNFFTPASFAVEIDGMVSVAAIDTGDNYGELCGFSNYSASHVELSAPGCHIVAGLSGLLGAYKENKYGFMSGTSMASPIAAAFALLSFSYLRDQQNLKLKPSNLEEFLKKASRKSTVLESHIQQGKTVDLETLKDKIISDDL